MMAEARRIRLSGGHQARESVTPPADALPSGTGAVRLDDRALISHSGAAAMPAPMEAWSR